MLFFPFVCVITQHDPETAVEHDDEANVSADVAPPSNDVDEDVELGEGEANDDVPHDNTMACSHCDCTFFCKHDHFAFATFCVFTVFLAITKNIVNTNIIVITLFFLFAIFYALA